MLIRPVTGDVDLDRLGGVEYYFPTDALTNYCKCSGLKQHKLFSLLGLEVRSLKPVLRRSNQRTGRTGSF